MNEQIEKVMLDSSAIGWGARNTTELEIRRGLCDRLRAANPDTFFRHEFTFFNMPQWRFDVAEFEDGAINGFEIKSDQDNTRRLSKQMEGYAKMCKLVTILTGYKHCYQVAKIVPGWVGIELVHSTNGIARFERVRAPDINPGWSHGGLIWMLWSAERKALFRRYGLKSNANPLELYRVRPADFVDCECVEIYRMRKLKEGGI